MPEETASHPSVWVMVGERHLLGETGSIVAQARGNRHSLWSRLPDNETSDWSPPGSVEAGRAGSADDCLPLLPLMMRLMRRWGREPRGHRTADQEQGRDPERHEHGRQRSQ